MSSKRSGRTARDLLLSTAERLFREQGPDVPLEEVAQQAGVSRQTVYLHFGSRAGLVLALVQFIDARGVLGPLIQRVFDARTAAHALDELVHLHAEYSPVAYPIARLFISRRHDDDALRIAWQDRMDARRRLYREVIGRLVAENALASGWTVESATDLLFAMTSWQLWEQLVVDQGWSKDAYRERLRHVLRSTLVAGSRSACRSPT